MLWLLFATSPCVWYCCDWHYVRFLFVVSWSTATHPDTTQPSGTLDNGASAQTNVRVRDTANHRLPIRYNHRLEMSWMQSCHRAHTCSAAHLFTPVTPISICNHNKRASVLGHNRCPKEFRVMVHVLSLGNLVLLYAQVLMSPRVVYRAGQSRPFTPHSRVCVCVCAW